MPSSKNTKIFPFCEILEVDICIGNRDKGGLYGEHFVCLSLLCSNILGIYFRTRCIYVFHISTVKDEYSLKQY